MLKYIKLNGWDEEFIKRIKMKRDDELLYTKKNLNIEIIRFMLTSNINLLLMIIALGLYVTSNDQLEISVLFTSFQLVNSMTFPIMLIPNFINQIFKDIISIQRLQNYLFTEEHQDRKRYENKEEYNKDKILVKFDKINFNIKEQKQANGIKYNNEKIEDRENSSDNLSIEMKNIDTKIYLNESNSEDEKDKNDVNTKLKNKEREYKKLNSSTEIDINHNLLKEISFSVKMGEFIAILGPTGSGKTCLLNAILNNYMPNFISSDSKMIRSEEHTSELQSR